MLFFKKASIRAKLLAIMTLSGIPIVLVFVYLIVNQYQDKRNEAEHEVISTVKSIAFEHTAQVEGIRNLLMALSQYPEIRLKNVLGSSRILNLILEHSPSNMNIGVADKDGRVIATGAKLPLPINFSIADRKYFKDAVSTKKFSSGEFFPKQGSNKAAQTLHFSLPILDSSGNTELVLYAALDLTSFAKIFDAQGLPAGSILNLTDHKGKVLLRYSRSGVDDQVGKSDHADLRGKMTGVKEEGAISGIGMDGTKRHFAFKRLRLSPGEPPYLYIRVSIPEQVATSKTRMAFGISMAVFFIAAVFTYVLTRIIAGLYIVHPLEQLVRASHLVENGNLSARSGLPYTNDEIGQLAKSFDDMTISLDDRLREISRAESENHRLAYYDSLTNLPNRRLLQDRLDLALIRSKRQNIGFALLYIDIDNFKHINDSLGHSAGDQLLKVVASRYLSILREDDIVCRLGGDEFAVILHDIQLENNLTIVVEKLLEATISSIVLDDRELYVSASIGIALYPKDADDASSLEKNADLALYHAKSEGKNTFRMFSEELNRTTHDRIDLIHALQHALERNELSLHYQPKFSTVNGMMVGVEALLRWNSAELGEVLPERFIPIAEENRMILPIGEWVLRNACEQQVAWKKQGCNLAMAVNISAIQLKSPNLIQSIKTIIEETGIAPEQLELELTESCLIDKPDEVIMILGKLRELRCNIAIDDFGTGYSSLSYLKNFPVNVLKIDRSFVKDLSNNVSDRAIARSIVDMANNLNMVTVAEGVEHIDQQQILEEIGCDYVQGFLHCRPVTPDQIPGIVQAKNA